MIPTVRKQFVFALAILSALQVYAREIMLPLVVDPLKGELLDTAVWDFSQQWSGDDRSGTSVHVYGDSLLAETVAGRRYWYCISGDSIFYNGEEDRLTTIVAERPVYMISGPLVPGSANGGITFTAEGKGGGRRFAVSERGTLGFAVARQPGTLILAPGDTVRNAIAVREIRNVEASFPDDSPAASTVMTTVTYRWYDSEGAASLLPLAVQRSVYASAAVTADAEPAVSSAYIPERGSLKNRGHENDSQETDPAADVPAIGAALSEASVTCDGRSVTVTAAIPEAGLTLTLDIMDEAGCLYLHDSTVTDGAQSEITLDCRSLRTGRYIAAIGIENIAVAPRKGIIIIR